MGRITEGLRRFARAVTATGGAARGAAADLKNEKSLEDLAPERPSNAEQGVGVRVVLTGLDRDRSAADGLASGAAAVVSAEAEVVRAQEAQGRASRGEEATRREQRAREASTREQRTLAQGVDHAAPLIGLRVLALIELVFLGAEIYFWYQVFTYDTNTDVPFLSVERLGALVLGLAIPMLGLLAARAAGTSWQRFLRYPATDAAGRRHQQGAVLATTLLLVLATYVVFTLVHWRYTPTDNQAVTGLTLPAVPAGLFFAGLIVADAVARAFGISEAAGVNVRRDAAVAADRAYVGVLADRVTTATAGWHTAWLALRSQVAVTLDSIGQVVATGEILVLRSRSRRADRPAGSDWAATAPAWTAPAEGGYAIPPVVMPAHLDLGQIPATLHALTAAVDVLAQHQPPALAGESAPRAELEELRARIRDLEDALLQAGPDAPADLSAGVQPSASAEGVDTGEDVDEVEDVEAVEPDTDRVVVPMARTGSPD